MPCHQDRGFQPLQATSYKTRPHAPTCPVRRSGTAQRRHRGAPSIALYMHRRTPVASRASARVALRASPSRTRERERRGRERDPSLFPVQTRQTGARQSKFDSRRFHLCSAELHSSFPDAFAPLIGVGGLRPASWTPSASARFPAPPLIFWGFRRCWTTSGTCRGGFACLGIGLQNGYGTRFGGPVALHGNRASSLRRIADEASLAVAERQAGFARAWPRASAGGCARGRADVCEIGRAPA